MDWNNIKRIPIFNKVIQSTQFLCNKPKALTQPKIHLHQPQQHNYTRVEGQDIRLGFKKKKKKPSARLPIFSFYSSLWKLMQIPQFSFQALFTIPNFLLLGVDYPTNSPIPQTISSSNQPFASQADSLHTSTCFESYHFTTLLLFLRTNKLPKLICIPHNWKF